MEVLTMNTFTRLISIAVGVCAVHFAMVACSGGDSTATSTAQAGPGDGGAGGGETCACPAPLEFDVPCELQNNDDPIFKYSLATLKIDGRTGASLRGTLAYGVPSTPSVKFADGVTTTYEEVPIYYRADNAVVGCGYWTSGGSSILLSSVHFIVPPAH